MTESQLDAALSEPTAELLKSIRQYRSPLLVLGAGGKMGPSISLMAQRAAQQAGHSLEVISVSRFTNESARSALEKAGIRTISCDLLREPLQRLPHCENLLYLVGQKFGTAVDPSSTWAVNTLIPNRVCERYRGSRIVALSTGNVYPFSTVSRGGSSESDPLTPSGEYANAAVARERIFEYHSREHGTPVALLRLFYAVELRYGVLVDIGRRVHAGEPVRLQNGYVTCIWQRDANELILRSLQLVSTPPSAFNLCRREVVSVREIAEQFGRLFGREPRFEGAPSDTALLGNASRLANALGDPPRSPQSLVPDIAAWIQSGGRDLQKPTRFEVRDGNY